MGRTEAQAEYDKLKGLLDALGTIVGRRDTKFEAEAEAALKVVGTDALSNLERNLCSARRNVLSELAGITKHFGG